MSLSAIQFNFSEPTDRPTFINPGFIGNFSPTPNWLLCRTEISSGAKILYARLCQFAGDNGKCFPGVKTLSDEIGSSQRQVARFLNELSDNDLIIRNRRGLTRTNTYDFPHHEWMDIEQFPKPVIKSNKINDLPSMAGHDLPSMAGHIYNTKGDLKEKTTYIENSEISQKSENPVVVFSDNLNNLPPIETAKNSKTDGFIKSDTPVKELKESQNAEAISFPINKNINLKTEETKVNQSAEPISLPVITRSNREIEEAKVNQNAEPISPPACKENNPESETEELLKQVKSGIPVTPNLRKIIRDGIKQHGIEYVKKCIEYTNEKSKTNYAGYLNLTIRCNWAAEWQSPIEKRQAQIKAEQEKSRRQAEKDAEFKSQIAKVESEAKERDSYRQKFIALSEGGKEGLKQAFFNDPEINFFMKKEARKRVDISESVSFLFWLKTHYPDLREKVNS
jgi:hypothetical protein